MVLVRLYLSSVSKVTNEGVVSASLGTMVKGTSGNHKVSGFGAISQSEYRSANSMIHGIGRVVFRLNLNH